MSNALLMRMFEKLASRVKINTLMRKEQEGVTAYKGWTRGKMCIDCWEVRFDLDRWS